LTTDFQFLDLTDIIQFGIKIIAELAAQKNCYPNIIKIFQSWLCQRNGYSSYKKKNGIAGCRKTTAI
jgi:hypothetical protein